MKHPRFGVLAQTSSPDLISQAAEEIALVGYTVVDGGYGPEMMRALSDAFDRARQMSEDRFGGGNALSDIDEQHVIRAPLIYDSVFLELLQNPTVVGICRTLIGHYIVLSQQNGIVNPPFGERYSQGSFHRDLPYQHFTSSKPLAINALFCLDDFTVENGATRVVPGSHKAEAFPSDFAVTALLRQITAPAGSFIILDCMIYHAGSANVSSCARRAVNHVYTIPLIRQQIDLPKMLGENFVNDPETQKILGYGCQTPQGIEDYYSSRRQRVAERL